MALSQIEQMKQLTQSKKNILITFKKHWDGDALGGALALKLFLEQMEKRVTVVCDMFVLPAKFSFLHKSLSVQSQIGDLHQFIINIDTAQSGLSELSYDIKENKLRIFITPKEGYLTKEQITTSQTEFKHDLIITVDSLDLHSLEKVYTGNENFFYQTPVINIDHKSSNENFGNINLIDLQASTSSEIIYHTLKQLKPEFITKEIATALLTGIITGTNSFKKKKVRPQTLVAASELVDLGADRGFIVKQMYQTKTIATFKLWGAALSHLEHDPQHKIIWTTLTREDFSRCGASTEDLPAIIDELITSSPDAELILLLHEHPTEPHVEGILRIIPAFHATEVMKKYNAQGDEDDTVFKINGRNLKEAENEIIAHIKSEITK